MAVYARTTQGRGTKSLSARHAQKRTMSTARLVKWLVFIVVFISACTYLLINTAHSLSCKKQLQNSIAYQSQIEHRIDAVRFEIQRELLPENLIYNAQTKLGMIRAAGLLTASSMQ